MNKNIFFIALGVIVSGLLAYGGVIRTDYILDKNDDSGFSSETNGNQQEATGQMSVNGKVESISADELVIKLTDGSLIAVEGRGWTYAQQQGFFTVAGNEVLVTGFLENGELEVTSLDDLSSGQSLQLRSEAGRPLWAGGGGGQGNGD